jgi:phospholipase C
MLVLGAAACGSSNNTTAADAAPRDGGTTKDATATKDGQMTAKDGQATKDVETPLDSRTDTHPPGADGGLLALARAKIKHVVIINQENRSFDTYFGTFPGADGIPMNEAGVPTVCSTVPADAGIDGSCEKPYHNPNDLNIGGPHSNAAFITCTAGGAMNGFVRSAGNGKGKTCTDQNDPNCLLGGTVDVMGYHDDREIPNYWSYAKHFALQDHMFEPVNSYSLPDHLFMVSAWAATCAPFDAALNCHTDLSDPGGGGGKAFKPKDAAAGPKDPEYAWTDITYLLHKNSVSWRYYVAGGKEPDCEDGQAECDAGSQEYTKPGYWNVLPWFDDVRADNEVGNVVDTTEFYTDVQSGKLATVSWLIPSGALSEHPPNLITRGQAYVTEIINEIMQSQYWDSTVIFLTWDDWGGFYDHVVPVVVNPDASAINQDGYGIRVPGMTISPWVKPGQIDKTVYSHDAYLRFIEDLFLDSARLDPANDGRPDNRPEVRETAPALGDLLSEFDFTQTPNAPLVLPPCPDGGDLVYSEAGACQP